MNYDIGAMAGMKMSDRRRPECIWYKEQVVRGRLVLTGLVKTEAGRELAVTILDTATSSNAAIGQSVARAPFKYPANFWATVDTDEDVVDTLLVALSYEAKP